MKKNLLLLGAIVLSAFVFVACNDDDKEPDPDPVYAYYVDVIKSEKESFKFNYNSDYTLNNVTRTDEKGQLVTKFEYEDGKLSKVTRNNTTEITFEYDGNEITVIDQMSSENPYVYTIDSKSTLESAIWVSDFDPKADTRLSLQYDDEGKLLKMTKQSYYKDVPETPSIMNTYQVSSYKYDNKNSIVHSGMLPLWYLQGGFPVVESNPTFLLSPINNITEHTSEALNFSGTTGYQYKYDEEGYPVECVADIEGMEDLKSVYTISYTKVEVK